MPFCATAADTTSPSSRCSVGASRRIENAPPPAPSIASAAASAASLCRRASAPASSRTRSRSATSALVRLASSRLTFDGGAGHGALANIRDVLTIVLSLRRWRLTFGWAAGESTDDNGSAGTCSNIVAVAATGRTPQP